MLQDAHVHLQDIADKKKLEQILSASSKAGVSRLFCACSRVEDWQKLKALASEAGVIPFYGLHPWHVGTAYPGWFKILRSHTAQGRCGIGEIGLDRTERAADFNLQLETFFKQLDLAIETRKPVTLHCLKAWHELINALKDRSARLPKIMLHSFAGPLWAQEELTRLGAFFSFSPSQLNSTSNQALKSLAEVPLERLLLETDYPYLHLRGQSGDVDYLNYLDSAYEQAASLFNIGREDLEKRIWDNGTLFTH